MPDPPITPQRPLLRTPAFLDLPTCERIRQAMDMGQREEAEIIERTIVQRDTIRRTTSIDIADDIRLLVEARFEAVRSSAAAAFHRSLADREGTGFLRYAAGDFYLPHRDRGPVAGWPAARRRSVALVLFLNDSAVTSRSRGFEGGTLCLYPDGDAPSLEIAPEAGLLVAFPADVLHEVRPVVRGTRDVAVDWFYDGEP